MAKTLLYINKSLREEVHELRRKLVKAYDRVEILNAENAELKRRMEMFS